MAAGASSFSTFQAQMYEKNTHTSTIWVSAILSVRSLGLPRRAAQKQSINLPDVTAWAAALHVSKEPNRFSAFSALSHFSSL